MMVSPVYLVANLNSIKLAANGTKKTEVYVIDRVLVIDKEWLLRSHSTINING